jgi:hypothetical protein
VSYLPFSLYHFAIGIKGDAATFYQLASTMNSKAAADDGIPNFQISKGQLKRWFGNMKG